MLINANKGDKKANSNSLQKPIPPQGHNLFVTMGLKNKEAVNDIKYKQLN